MSSEKADRHLLDVFSPAFYRSLQQLKIETRRTFLGSRQGAHLSHKKGHGLEFSGYRLYSPGDDFRHIDWRIYGRSDRLYVREFQEEQDLNVMFIIDCSHSMASPALSTPDKLMFAKQLALALGYAALTDGDTVSYMLLGSGTVHKFSGARSLSQIARTLENSGQSRQVDMKRDILLAASQLKTPGKCFLISDFLYDTADATRAVNILNSRNFDVTLFQILSPEDISLSGLPDSSWISDSESGEKMMFTCDETARRTYASLLSQHVKSLEEYSARNGIRHVLVSTAEKVDELVLSRLPELGLLT